MKHAGKALRWQSAGRGVSGQLLSGLFCPQEQLHPEPHRPHTPLAHVASPSWRVRQRMGVGGSARDMPARLTS